MMEAERDDLAACTMIWWKRGEQDTQRQEMTIRYSSRTLDQWTAVVSFPEEAHYIRYGFELLNRDGTRRYLSATGLSAAQRERESFELLQANETDVVSVPDWTQGCVYYQIFPERYDPGGTDGALPAGWHAEPTRDNYLGGTLRGIIERIPYLYDLGVECLYLTPVFAGDFNHKYATVDYFSVDPQFGSEQGLVELVRQAHDRGIRVILDGVFNHTGIRFAPFADLMEKGRESRYTDWFYPKQYPIRIDAACYECVGDYPYMPRLNGAEPQVRAYVKDVLLYWMERAQIDGWRLDVADELDRHALTYWREQVKAAGRDAVLLGETWGDATRLVGPDGVDCAMNYLYRDAMVAYFARESISETELDDRLQSMLMRYPDAVNLAMYNCLGSHDTARFLTEAGGDKTRLKLAMAFQILFPGAPAVYYGDEIGMTGENDPGCRGGMAWDRMDKELLRWQKSMIALRKKHEALRTGGYRTLLADNRRRIFAFERTGEQERIIAVFNMDAAAHDVDFAGRAKPVHTSPRSVKIIIHKEEKASCVSGKYLRSPR